MQTRLRAGTRHCWVRKSFPYRAEGLRHANVTGRNRGRHRQFNTPSGCTLTQPRDGARFHPGAAPAACLRGVAHTALWFLVQAVTTIKLPLLTPLPPPPAPPRPPLVIAPSAEETPAPSTTARPAGSAARATTGGSAAARRVAERPSRGADAGAGTDKERLDRTLFVGNLPLTMNAKRLARFFQRAVTAASPPGTTPSPATPGVVLKGYATRDVESVRFRSVPLGAIPVQSGANFHTMLRASFNTVGPAGAGAAPAVIDEKKGGKGAAATPLATRSSMNAYIVFRTPAAAVLGLTANGSELDEHVLRVDMASVASGGARGGGGRPAAAAAASAAGGAAPVSSSAAQFDRKRSVFVGGLSWSTTEDELRAHFGARVTGGQACVEGVRVVRDRVTGKGKGIGFVLFRERGVVAEARGLAGTLRDGKALRVTRAGTAREKGVAVLPSFAGARGRGEKIKVKKARSAGGRNAPGSSNGQREGKGGAPAVKVVS